MKKKLLCFFSLVLYLLIACTLLSRKIQEEMMTQVEIGPVNTKGPHEQVTRELPARMLFTDETGNHAYEVIDGAGWEDGLRTREVGNWYLNADGGVSIPSYPDSRYVLAATRQPRPGEQVEILESTERSDDKYLAVYANGAPEELSLPSNTADVARSGQAMLLTMTGVTRPFMEHKAKTMSLTTDHARHIFSLPDVEQFFAQLPNVAAVVLALAAGLIFCAHARCLSFREDAGGWLFWLDVGIVAVTLCLLPFLLRRFDLPASLLPKESIFQLSHYREEFFLFFTAIQDFPDAAQALTAAKDQALHSVRTVLDGGSLAVIVILLLETAAIRWRTRRKQRAAKE